MILSEPIGYTPPARCAPKRRRGTDELGRAMTGSIVRLIEDRQAGTIAGEDGIEYAFRDAALVGITFGSLGLGTRVLFTPDPGRGAPRAHSVRVPKGS